LDWTFLFVFGHSTRNNFRIFLYVVLIAVIGGAGYLIREQFFPASKGKKKGSARVKRADGPAVSAPKVLQDEWIPEHVKNVGSNGDFDPK
jgi:hypothetical protein